MAARDVTSGADDELTENGGNLQNILVDTVLNLEKLEVNLYRSSNHWKPLLNTHRIFGGQVVGQALVAAGKTIDEQLHAHSLHAYFVRSGQNKKPVVYQVERTRDGNSFATRTIKAIQNGESILSMQVSFTKAEYSKFQHQYKMPEVPLPEELQSEVELTQKHLDENSHLFPDRLIEYIRKRQAREIPLEVKPVSPPLPIMFQFMYGDTDYPRRMMWMKSKGIIGDDEHLNRCTVAYMSDMMLASTSWLSKPQTNISMMTSLDHSMWFHSPFRADQWLLYECESPHTGNGRGFNLGRIWTQEGTLAVSVAQECVIRSEPKSKL
ncbi:acyl-coenzyme A thioesterase 8-like [Saccoglossus kowalevskii]|uniref:Acyl-coenzyme A thioesterase 8-like n=1 Tax=Saccoglossus kowalevskii TaxID=10224 RepID=A0ABM0MYQ5_SACKO|nr:PREDICTED: acyl-coenzyme A thioesterase 8-like [Saccoglossus kowalevskii]